MSQNATWQEHLVCEGSCCTRHDSLPSPLNHRPCVVVHFCSCFEVNWNPPADFAHIRLLKKKTVPSRVLQSSVDVCLFVRNKLAPEPKARVPASCQEPVTMETWLHPAVWQFPNDFRALQPRPVRARSVGVPLSWPPWRPALCVLDGEVSGPAWPRCKSALFSYEQVGILPMDFRQPISRCSA